MYFLYFALSVESRKVYVGCTSKDPKIRVSEHNSGSNNWTKRNRPLKLIYYEKYYCKKDARPRELFYKTGVGKRIKRAIVNEMDA